MGRAEAGVTSSIKRSGIDFCNLLAEREGDRFQVFFDLYMEGYIKHESINTKHNRDFLALAQKKEE